MASHPLLRSPATVGDLERVERELRRAVETEEPALTEMASHLIVAGGKRIRPLLALAAGACAEDHDGPATHSAVMGAVSVELVHLGSLHHDDVIDEAVTRRRVQSVNAKWGNLRAILSGDFLLAKASEIAAGLGTETAALLASTIGRLCQGEVAELQTAYQLERSEASYLRSIAGKTATLFSAATRIGAIVGELPREHIDRLTEFGTAYGMAFQVIDDILDLVATDEQLGKPAGHDLIEGVYTLPVLRALRAPGAEELSGLLGRPVNGEDWERARSLVRASGGVEEAIGVARHYTAYATECLGPLGHRPAAQALMESAGHLLSGVESFQRS